MDKNDKCPSELCDVIVEHDGNYTIEKKMAKRVTITTEDWINFCKKTNIDYNSVLC